MANLEAMLDGPSVGYCSSSEGEDEAKSSCLTNDDNAQQPSGATPKTGPKGVLADYERHRLKQMAAAEEQEKALLKMANRFSLETPVNKQPFGEEEDEDELQKIRRNRLEQLKNMAKGRILEVSDRFEFLQLIEQHSSPGCLLFMHIYADGNEHSNQLNDALLELAGRFGQKMAKFYKVQTNVLGTSNKFTRDALPALQIYQSEQLIGNFVRLTTELGDDYDGEELLKFLRRNGIPLD